MNWSNEKCLISCFIGSILFYGSSAGKWTKYISFVAEYFLIVFFYYLDGDDIPGIGQYEDFHTIDWQRDIARDRMRHRYIVKKIQDSVWDFLKVNKTSNFFPNTKSVVYVIKN